MNNLASTDRNKPIDVVIPWVDGNDPAHRARRIAAMGGDSAFNLPDVGGDTRYAQMGELRWVLASINRFMPWVRRIYIVTDRQRPDKELDWVSQRIDNPIEVEIVDHTTIFGNDSDLLPTFNCASIETMLWRIPGLSERYIYFNDDTFVMAPMSPDEWFDGDKLICHGHRFNLIWARLLQWLKPRRHGHKPQGFKTPMIAAARQLHKRHFIYYYHSPVAQSKSLLADYLTSRPDTMRANAAPKFRDISQFSPHSLCNLLAEQAGRLKLVRRNINLFLKPKASRPDYLKRRLACADRNPRLKLGCINSLDLTTDIERDRFDRWICNRLRVKQ